MADAPQFPLTRKRAPRRLPYRNVVKAIRGLKGHAFARAANVASKVLGRGITLSFEPDTGFYRVTDSFGTHLFAYSARLWTVWDGLAYRADRLGVEYLIDAVPLVSGDTIVEVGANTGDLTLHLQARGVAVNMICFEPAPKEFAVLKANLAASTAVTTFEAHQLALWNEATEGLTFYLSGIEADNSLVPISHYTDTITVPTARLDSVLKRQAYKLLKLEAEGAEPEILEGAAGVLDCFEYITADVGFERGVRAESTLPQVANTLLNKGFEIVGFDGRRFTLLFRRIGAPA